MAEVNKYAVIIGNCIAASDTGPAKILTGKKGICVDSDDTHTVLLLEEGRFKVPNEILSVVGGEIKEEFT
jgi:hypothetical protein